MASFGYEDFAIEFERRGARSYDVTARDAAGHQAHGSFELPLDRDLLHAVQVLGLTRDVGGGDRSVQERTAQEIGGQLASALLDEPVVELLDEALLRADGSGVGVRLRLSLGATPELLDVPWELMYRRPTFLASQRRTPIVRFLDLGDSAPRQRIDGTVRILGVVANPRGLPRLDV